MTSPSLCGSWNTTSGGTVFSGQFPTYRCECKKKFTLIQLHEHIAEESGLPMFFECGCGRKFFTHIAFLQHNHILGCKDKKLTVLCSEMPIGLLESYLFKVNSLIGKEVAEEARKLEFSMGIMSGQIDLYRNTLTGFANGVNMNDNDSTNQGVNNNNNQTCVVPGPSPSTVVKKEILKGERGETQEPRASLPPVDIREECQPFIFRMPQIKRDIAVIEREEVHPVGSNNDQLIDYSSDATQTMTVGSQSSLSVASCQMKNDFPEGENDELHPVWDSETNKKVEPRLEKEIVKKEEIREAENTHQNMEMEEEEDIEVIGEVRVEKGMIPDSEEIEVIHVEKRREDESESSSISQPPIVSKKGRGRPPKAASRKKYASSSNPSPATSTTITLYEEPPVKKSKTLLPTSLSADVSSIRSKRGTRWNSRQAERVSTVDSVCVDEEEEEEEDGEMRDGTIFSLSNSSSRTTPVGALDESLRNIKQSKRVTAPINVNTIVAKNGDGDSGIHTRESGRKNRSRCPLHPLSIMHSSILECSSTISSSELRQLFVQNGGCVSFNCLSIHNGPCPHPILNCDLCTGLHNTVFCTNK